ncbi:MAG: hypothetical protein KAZ36_01790 [Bacteroidales bacterium]|nr:hypothetical protein [Bacteroidales bacterium]
MPVNSNNVKLVVVKKYLTPDDKEKGKILARYKFEIIDKNTVVYSEKCNSLFFVLAEPQTTTPNYPNINGFKDICAYNAIFNNSDPHIVIDDKFHINYNLSPIPVAFVDTHPPASL